MPTNFLRKLFPGGIKFWQKNQSILGVDVGSSSIKIVQLRKEGEQAILETYGELAVGPFVGRPFGQVSHLTVEAAVNMLKSILKESNATAKRAVVGIPIRSSFVTTIKVPVVAEKSLEEVIRYEARRYVPAPLNEVEMNWQLLGDREGQEGESGDKSKVKMAEVLLVVIHKDVIQKYKDIFAKAGLKIEHFEIEIFSVWRSSLFRPTTPVMLIDFGASTTKMSIVDAGVLRASHTLDRGAQAITQSIAQSLSISFERAEEMKRDLGLSVRPEHKELRNIMESVLGVAFVEGKQFAQAYRKNYGKSVGQIILAGGGALLNGIVDMAVKNFGVEIILADSFSKVKSPPFLE